VHVIVSQIDGGDEVLVEMIEIEQQTRLDREERTLGQAQANKELVRNLAHEIKNPLGGIRGAAQLLAMEVDSRELTEYTQVIIHEADRLQALVDRLLAPHRRAHGGRRRQHPRGLRACAFADAGRVSARAHPRARLRRVDPRVPRRPRAADPGGAQHRAQRDAGAGQPAHPPGGRLARGDARIVLRTRVARQVTFGKQRFGWHWNCICRTTGRACPRPSATASSTRWCGREGGSGLGLTLAQTFVQQHQGTIECDSIPGRTVFKVLIPLP
jgi:two-component system nitrogen regulation sensor histidine kinase GlnL